MSSIVTPSSFRVSNVTFSPVKMLESGGKQAYLNYETRPLLMQVGSLETPFGLSVYDKTSPPKYTVELNLRGYDDAAANPKVAAIYNAFQALDDHMVEQAVKNSRAWFKTDLTRDMAKMLYSPTMRWAKDAEGNVKPYPPTLKIQLRKRDDKFETVVYDDKKRLLNDVPLEDILVKRAFLTVLVQCTGVWFAGGKFGLSWKAVQIRADKIPESIRGCAIMDDDEDAPAAKAAPPAPKKPAASSNQFADAFDDEVDDEEALKPTVLAPKFQEDEEEEPIPVPVKKPAPVIKKKIVVPAAKKA